MRRWILFGCGVFFASLSPVAARTEEGLEQAVEWIWKVAPSDPGQWVVKRPEPTPGPTPTPQATPEQVFYEVKRGDALAIIARKYGLTVEHLKVHNGLESNLIRIGEVLKIPSRAEAIAIAPLPTPRPKKTSKSQRSAEVPGVTVDQLQTGALQAYLDRQQFSAGPIDGLRGATLNKVLHYYTTAYPEMAEPGKLEAAIESEVGDGFARYVLQEADFQFITPPKAARPVASPAGDTKSPSGGPTYEEMVKEPRLLYRTPWEFVAERFHCDEKFLKDLNTQVKSAPTIGTVLRVPNVIPFRMEKIVWETMQPAPEREKTTQAVIVDLSILQIFQRGQLVAVMPVSSARPGLRGRDEWTIHQAIPLPQMGTFRETKEKPRRPQPLYGQPEPTSTPDPRLLLTTEQFLPPGPNNPVGLAWIQLSKSDSDEILPYGLHGTSIPDQMESTYSLGGFQLANWNIVRAVRMLPPGTELAWRSAGFMPSRAPVPVAAPAP